MSTYAVTVNGVMIGYVNGDSQEDVYWTIVGAGVRGCAVPTTTGYVKVHMDNVAVIQITLEGN